MFLREDRGKIFHNIWKGVILAAKVGNQFRGAWMSRSRKVRRCADQGGVAHGLQIDKPAVTYLDHSVEEGAKWLPV